METSPTNTEQSLYQSQQTIYNRNISGKFNTIRNLFFLGIAGIYYLLPWITWNNQQAVLFDISNREFHFFNITFLPQDILYLSLLLIISAYLLFLFTAVAGRLFCGYVCPQTVYSNIYMKVESWIEGNYIKRKRLDASPISFTKFRIKFTKFLIWGLIGLWTGFTFIAYFDPTSSILADIKNLSLSGWQVFFLVFCGAMSIFLAGFMREQVCKFMCPYARFQSVMFDKDTLIVSYDPVIGEPRGKRKKNDNLKTVNKGFCVDCRVCVDVCPTGIDIRDGLQYECIGCGACIDGCDDMMHKFGYPSGLVRYTSEKGIEQRLNCTSLILKIIRPRIIIYSLILIVLLLALSILLYIRNPIKTTIIQDRAAFSRVLDKLEMIEGVYQLRITNSDSIHHNILIEPKGIEGIIIENLPQPIELPPEFTETFIFNVRVPMTSVDYAKNVNKEDKNYNITFEIKSITDQTINEIEKSTFIVKYRK